MTRIKSECSLKVIRIIIREFSDFLSYSIYKNTILHPIFKGTNPFCTVKRICIYKIMIPLFSRTLVKKNQAVVILNFQTVIIADTYFI